MDQDQSQAQGAQQGASSTGGFQPTPPPAFQPQVPQQAQPQNPMPVGNPVPGNMGMPSMPPMQMQNPPGGMNPPTPPTPPAPPTPPIPASQGMGQPIPAQTGGQAQTGQSFSDFKQQQAGQQFKPSTPVTSTLGMSEEEILQGDKNIFGRPIPIDPNKPQDAKGQFEAILNTQVTPNPALTYDAAEFLELLAGSISLLFEEKQEILRMLPQMKQEQMNQLLTILKDEKQKFNELVEQHKQEMADAKVKQMEEAKVQSQQTLAQEQSQKSQDIQAAEDLLKGL